MRRPSAGALAMIAAGAVAAALAVLLLLKLLGVLAAPSPEAPTPVGPSASSTLDGGIVSDGAGWSIRQVATDAVPGAGGTDFPPVVVRSDRTIYLERGGSGSPACASNFTGIELRGDELRLTHRAGDGTAEACTDDYRLTYFEIDATGAAGLDDVRQISIYEGTRWDVTYSSDDWASGRWTAKTS